MPSVSAFLIVKNEAQDLPDCLTSLHHVAQEIVVVDSGSTDRTREIAAEAGAMVLTRPFDGFAAQKQFALDHCTGDWALSIDADERVTQPLAVAIQALLQNPQAADGYRIRREMYFRGHRLRFGGVGVDWPMRFFKRSKGRYRPVSVHESIEVEGPVERLNAPLLHYSYRSIEEYNTKCDHYTTLAAEDLYKKGRRFTWLDHLRPGWELFSRVVLQSAWLDGQPGLTYAFLSARAAWLRAIKLRDKQKSSLAGHE